MFSSKHYAFTTRFFESLRLSKRESFLKVQLSSAPINLPEKKDLDALGTVYPLTGTNFDAVMLRKEEVEFFLQKKLEDVFAECPANRSYEIQNGYIVNIDLHQQKALLEAINQKNPKLKLGFFTRQAADKVCEILNRAQVHKRSNIWWFWTGEKLNAPVLDIEKKDLDFTEYHLVFEDRLQNLDQHRFAFRFIGGGLKYYFAPGQLNTQTAVVFGARRQIQSEE